MGKIKEVLMGVEDAYRLVEQEYNVNIEKMMNEGFDEKVAESASHLYDAMKNLAELEEVLWENGTCSIDFKCKIPMHIRSTFEYFEYCMEEGS